METRIACEVKTGMENSKLQRQLNFYFSGLRSGSKIKLSSDFIKIYPNFFVMKSSTSFVKTSQRDSELQPSIVHTVLDKGREVNFARCHGELKSIVIDQQRSIGTFKSNPKPKKKLFKILYPHKLKYPKCQHQKNFVLNRSKMLPSDHLSLLANPKKVI